MTNKVLVKEAIALYGLREAPEGKKDSYRVIGRDSYLTEDGKYRVQVNLNIHFFEVKDKEKKAPENTVDLKKVGIVL